MLLFYFLRYPIWSFRCFEPIRNIEALCLPLSISPSPMRQRPMVGDGVGVASHSPNSVRVLYERSAKTVVCDSSRATEIDIKYPWVEQNSLSIIDGECA